MPEIRHWSDKGSAGRRAIRLARHGGESATTRGASSAGLHSTVTPRDRLSRPGRRLGAWLGVKTSLLTDGGWDGALRGNALFFGATVVAAGAAQVQLGWKHHFLPVHLHLGVNILLAALVAGTGSRTNGLFYLTGLLLASAGSALYAQRARRFAFLLYALLYGYLGFTIFVFEHVRWDTEGFILYFLTTAAALVSALVAFHRRFRSAE